MFSTEPSRDLYESEYTFDALGRQTLVTHPDAGETHYQYFPTGQLKKTWGTRTYPIEYTYTDQ